MKKFILPLILAIASTTAMADTTPKADIIRTTYGDFDAQGQLLSSNETALKAMNFKKVEKKANKGDKDAQFYLAKMYQLGIHTQKDDKKAMEWYKKSAENGNANAMNNLAAYLNGDMYYGLENNAEALAWFNKAIAQNHPVAMYNLAYYYVRKNDNSDIQKGVELLLKAGEMGFAPAYYALSDSFGEDIIQDENSDDATKEQVYFDRNTFLTKSAEMGFAPAQMALSDYYQMNYVMSIDKSVRPTGVINAYKWANRACVNGIERGCQTAEYFGSIKTADFSDEKAKCEQGDKLYCESLEMSEAIKKALIEMDKKLVK